MRGQHRRALSSTAWAPVPPMIVTWAVLAQVVSFRGLVIWVVGGSMVMWWVVGALLSAGRGVLAMAVGAGMTVGLAALADSLGGSTSGPLARTTLLTCGLLLAALVLAFGSAPSLSLAPMLALLGSALALGAAASVAIWVGAWAVAACVSLVILGPYGSRDLAHRDRISPFALLLMGAGLAAVIAVAVAGPLLRDPWTIPGAGQQLASLTSVQVGSRADEAEAPLAPSPRPVAPAIDADSLASSAVDPVVGTPPLTTAPADDQASWMLWWAVFAAVFLLGLLLILVLVLIIALARRLWVSLLWLRLRLRLTRGSAGDRAIGSWTWVRVSMARFDQPLPPWAAPDVTRQWARSRGDESLALIADLAATAAFNPSSAVSSQEARQAWRQATRVARRHRRGSLRQRWRWSRISPDRAVLAASHR